MTYPFTRIFLAVSGAIAALIGISILFIPHTFFASNHIALGTDPNMMSEIRAPGGLLLASGVVMVCGAIMRSVLRAGLLTSAVVFSMYDVSRLVSLALDGVPSSSILGALVIELVVGGIAAVLIARFGVARSKS